MRWFLEGAHDCLCDCAHNHPHQEFCMDGPPILTRLNRPICAPCAAVMDLHLPANVLQVKKDLVRVLERAS